MMRKGTRVPFAADDTEASRHLSQAGSAERQHLAPEPQVRSEAPTSREDLGLVLVLKVTRYGFPNVPRKAMREEG